MSKLNVSGIRLFICWLTMIVLMAPIARGGDFFNVTATGGGQTVTAGGGTLLNLADNLISQQGQFASLAGVGFNGSLSYGGVPNAIQFSENAAQTSATITIPSTGFTRTFTGTSASDLQNQIHNFLEQDASSAYSDFLKTVDQTSPVAAIDGNPQASTAFIAAQAFERFGPQRTIGDTASDSSHGLQFQFSAEAGVTDPAGINGNYVDVALGANWKFGDHVSLSLATIGQYREVGGSAAYTLGEIIGVPITVINRNSDGIAWDLTPWGFAALSASYDQLSGAVLVGGGGTSDLSLQLGDFVFSLGDQLGYNSDVAVTIDQYHFDTPVDQPILTNGVQVAWNPGGGAFFVDGGIARTDFLQKAAVPDYWTPTLGVGLHMGKNSSLRIGYIGDLANGYTSTGAQATLALKL